MPIYRSKTFQITGIAAVLIFAALLAVRIGLFETKSETPQDASVSTLTQQANAMISERDTWMNILQNGRKIGFSHTRLFKTSSPNEGPYRLEETVFMRINTMGMVQDIRLATYGMLTSDLSLRSFQFSLSSGRFRFEAAGTVEGDMLTITTQNAGIDRKTHIKIRNKPYMAAGIFDSVRASGLKLGQTFSFDIFDPATMDQETVMVKVLETETISVAGIEKPAVKISLIFKGISQLAWIDETGDVVKQTGWLGISLEKTTRDNAMNGVLQSSDDLTDAASVKSNLMIKNPETLNQLTVKISGIAIQDLQLSGGRQTIQNNILTIVKESLPESSQATEPESEESLKEFLQPDMFIQSDHSKILEQVQRIVLPTDTPLEKIKKLTDWIHANIEKRPVLSVPDAVSTLENRMGDCNEHSVLLAAMARAAGIPAQIEAGLVYLNGGFYYHAWNRLYAGKWITVDALFNQIPADVTHIRLSTGDRQLDLMGVLGKIQLSVLDDP